MCRKDKRRYVQSNTYSCEILTHRVKEKGAVEARITIGDTLPKEINQ